MNVVKCAVLMNKKIIDIQNMMKINPAWSKRNGQLGKSRYIIWIIRWNLVVNLIKTAN